MCKFQKGDMLVVLQSSDRNNVGKVGAVIDITDGDYYTLDVMPNYAFKEDCLKKAHGADLIREERFFMIMLDWCQRLDLNALYTRMLERY